MIRSGGGPDEVYSQTGDDVVFGGTGLYFLYFSIDSCSNFYYHQVMM